MDPLRDEEYSWVGISKMSIPMDDHVFLLFLLFCCYYNFLSLSSLKIHLFTADDYQKHLTNVEKNYQISYNAAILGYFKNVNYAWMLILR
jgi:hypothetical protein